MAGEGVRMYVFAYAHARAHVHAHTFQPGGRGSSVGGGMTLLLPLSGSPPSPPPRSVSAVMTASRSFGYCCSRLSICGVRAKPICDSISKDLALSLLALTWCTTCVSPFWPHLQCVCVCAYPCVHVYAKHKSRYICILCVFVCTEAPSVFIFYICIYYCI